MNARSGNRKAALLVAVVFVLGIALGAVGMYLVTTRVLAARAVPDRSMPGRVAMYTRDLKLNGDQQQQIQKILMETRARYAEIHKQADPEYDMARKQGRERIRQLLTPEQLPKFEELLRQMDEERRARQAAAGER
jgi:Spy/CpxP family protein refolding chaperone